MTHINSLEPLLLLRLEEMWTEAAVRAMNISYLLFELCELWKWKCLMQDVKYFSGGRGGCSMPLLCATVAVWVQQQVSSSVVSDWEDVQMGQRSFHSANMVRIFTASLKCGDNVKKIIATIKYVSRSFGHGVKLRRAKKTAHENADRETIVVDSLPQM